MLSSLVILSCLMIGLFFHVNFVNHLIYAENSTSIKIGETLVAKEPFYQSINGTIISVKSLNSTEFPQNEVSFVENATINGNLKVINKGIFVDTIHPKKLEIGVGKGLIQTLDGQNATWNANDVGRTTINGSTLFKGVIYFETDSNGTLAFLDGKVGILISNVGKENFHHHIYEWTIE